MKESLAESYPNISSEWDYEANCSLRPENISCHSNKKVYWICNNGHKWDATVYHRVSGEECPYCLGIKPVVGVNDLATTNPKLAEQWHPTLNGDLKPTDVTATSGKIVYWICEKGHSWPAPVYRRNNGSKCGICTNRVLAVGINDLQTFNPVLAAQWHPTLNAPLLPTMILPSSKKKVFWICEKGHEWSASVCERKHGTGCPTCNGKKADNTNSLQKNSPDIAKEWHPFKNGVLTPNNVTANSHRKVWWQGECGHEWEATIYCRKKNGCPICSNRIIIAGINDLATTDIDLAKEWHPTRNGTLTPQMVSCGSRKKVWWLGICGHEWPAAIVHRHNGVGCPICSGRVVKRGINDLATLSPKLAAEWHSAKNGDMTPLMFTAGSGKSVWWQCPNCGHEWKRSIAERYKRQRGCPNCNKIVRPKTKYV